MARSRVIKPFFFTDEKVIRLTRDERLLFIGLWTLADDNAVGQADPVLVRAQLFPKDADVSDKRVQDWLTRLAKMGMIRLYRPQKRSSDLLYFVCNLHKHQKIDNRTVGRFPVPKSAAPTQKSVGSHQKSPPEFEFEFGFESEVGIRSRGGPPKEPAGDTSPAEEDLSQSTPTTDLDLGRDVISWMEATANGQRFRKHWAHKGKASRGPTENMKGTLREKERTIGAENFRQAWVDFLAGEECTARWPYGKFMDGALDRRMEELVEAQVRGRHAAEVAQEAEERNLGFPG